MPKYSDENIDTSQAKILCFASSVFLTPADIHGDKTEVLPMSEVSAYAAMMAEREPKLPTLFSAKIVQAREIFMRTKNMPFVAIELRDGRLLSSFFVRRHRADDVSDLLIIQSTLALFSFITRHAVGGKVLEAAIERPTDATKSFDVAVSMLPDLVTIHKEAAK